VPQRHDRGRGRGLRDASLDGLGSGPGGTTTTLARGVRTCTTASFGEEMS